MDDKIQKKFQIFQPEITEYLMWTEPDEGSYGFCLAPIRSRYDHGEIILPNGLIEYVIRNASKYYPIIVIDGYQIDSLLDQLNSIESKAWQPELKFGDYPRIIVSDGNTEHRDSVAEFKEHFKGAEAVARIKQEEARVLEAKIGGIRDSIAYHLREIEIEKKALAKLTS